MFYKVHVGSRKTMGICYIEKGTHTHICRYYTVSLFKFKDVRKLAFVEIVQGHAGIYFFLVESC